MNRDTKIILSEQELQLAYNKDWILTKQKITASVYQLFATLSESIKEELLKAEEWMPDEVMATSPKINKGENYLQLPYVLLDYPRFFTTDDIFAIRTMFWWGNFFSCTLLLDGKYKTKYQSLIANNLLKSGSDFYICISPDKWQHHFEKDNYCSLQTAGKQTIEKIITEKEFIKIALKYPLQKWHEIPALIKADIKRLLGLLKN